MNSSSNPTVKENMKYRESDGAEFRIATAADKEELIRKLDELGREYDFIDVKYSDGRTQYSALAVVRKKAAAKKTRHCDKTTQSQVR